jgi:hypothetical protein
MGGGALHRHPSFGFLLTAITAKMSHKKGRRAQPRNGFYIFSCGGFERKLL